MKNIMFVLVVLVIQTLYAQDSIKQESIKQESNTSSNNTFGAAVIKYSRINGQGAFLLGARGGWMANDFLAIGAGVYGLVSTISVSVIDKNRSENNSDNVDFIYGGAEVSYMFSPNNILHFAVNTLVGMGKISVNYAKADDLNLNFNNYHGGDTFFVAEPGVSIMANISSFLRFDLGVSHRFASGVDDRSITFQDVSGFNGILALRLGNF
ncbi:MAG: hypothetical protein KDC90_12050 [Ignavibacteriae bacterium]|nr:hypothetical protein [Ignavibacteriota bacterium]